MRDEVVLITGGSSGIGLATAHAFAREGARVVLTARDEERLDRAAHEVGRGATWLSADVTDSDSVASLAEELASRAGRLDILLNSAGQLTLGPCEESSAVAEKLMRVNYLGPVRTIAHTLPLIRKGRRKSIINLSSFAGRLTPPYWSAYAASKHALQSYSNALRQELRRERIHVGIVMPGPVQSPMTEDLLGSTMYPLPPGIPVIQPEQVSDAILRTVRSRRNEVTVPGRFGSILRLAGAFPRAVDLVYRFVK